MIDFFKSFFFPKKNENIIKFLYTDILEISNKSFNYEITEDDSVILLENGYYLTLLSDNTILLSIPLSKDYGLGDSICSIQNLKFDNSIIYKDEEFHLQESSADTIRLFQSCSHINKSIQYDRVDGSLYLLYNLNRSIMDFIQ